MNWSESNEKNYSEENRSENSENQTERPARESRELGDNTRRRDGNYNSSFRDRQPVYRADRSENGNSYSSYGNRQNDYQNRPQQRYRQGGYNNDENGRSYNRYPSERNYNRVDNGERNYNRTDNEERNYNRIDNDDYNYNRIDNGERNYNRREGGYDNRPRTNSYNNNRSYQGGNYNNRDGNSYERGSYGNDTRYGNNNRYGSNNRYGNNNGGGRSFLSNTNGGGSNSYDRRPMNQPSFAARKTPLVVKKRPQLPPEEDILRLNRYIAMSGVCSRRDADNLITEGRVKVNGEVIRTVGIKVKRIDEVEVDGNRINPERKVYIVLNKPKDYVTTVEDPLERKTVMTLIEGACKERVYPIGRLDRQTTGVLLFTNDGDLSKKLTHPKYNHKKIYHVFLDKPLTDEDCEKIKNGIELEDGMIQADKINFVTDGDHSQIGIEIHSGRNRIVRRIFEFLGYQILKLDRAYFAGITKKNLPRGQWRFLDQREISILKSY